MRLALKEGGGLGLTIRKVRVSLKKDWIGFLVLQTGCLNLTKLLFNISLSKLQIT